MTTSPVAQVVGVDAVPEWVRALSTLGRIDYAVHQRAVLQLLRQAVHAHST